MTTHILKTWPVYFDAIKRGEKTFECRLNDRGFQAGDVVVLQRTYESDKHCVEYEYAPLSPPRAKHELRFKIGYVLHGFGIVENWCVFSLLPMGCVESDADEDKLRRAGWYKPNPNVDGWNLNSSKKGRHEFVHVPRHYALDYLKEGHEQA